MSVLSSSFHKRRFKYGIFLSFRGEDTRTSFTDHLYSALTRVGIETFRDDKSLERGEDFAPDLLRAIGESWGSIIVFSEQYAFSHWCLVELVEIMKQREERGHRVYPIFYHVEPSDFRHQKNAVGEAFKEHERKYDNEKTQSWRRALQQVTGISGWPLKLDQHESAFVEGIVKEILEKLDVEILDEQEVIKLKSTYKRIQAVLRDAENKQYMKDGETVKVWFDELKHMAYDVEDVLDEWNTGILKSQIERDQAQTPSTSSSLSTKVHNTQNLFGGIALRIKELNKRLEATRVKDYFPLAVDINSITYPKLDQRPKTTSLVDESVVCGRDNDKRDLIDRLLLSDNNGEGESGGNGIPLTAIVGMGGLGKTTLAQLAFNNVEVKKHFPQRIWVCVSDPFDEVRIAKAILESLKGSPSKFDELESLLQEIRQKIEGKKFLLVLDDVWTEDGRKWEPLKLSLSSGSQESRILVTTRKEKVATLMHCRRPLIKPKVLSSKDSWSLFSMIAFFGRSEGDCENLKSIGRQFVKKCGGLPLAIKTVASLLRFKGTREQWQRILDSEMWNLEDEIFENLYAPLLLSYYDLPMSIKQCFRYCAIFPKDHWIRRDEVIKLWMAQDFLGEGNELEMMGEECFHNLAVRGFFQEFKKDFRDGSIIRCKMHDIVHDFAQFLTKTECLLVEGHRQLESCNENVRHLNLIDHIPIIDGIKGVDKLRSFLLRYNSDHDLPKLYASLPKLFHQLINLRVLGFYRKDRWSGNLRIPIKEIGKLIHLRYLDLERNTGLIELPETFCDLCNLQTLNIRRCYKLERLPRGMQKLINLRHLLNAFTCIVYMPKGMERLTSLQTLEEFRVSSSSDSFSLANLGKLIHLRGELTIRGLRYLAEASEAQLSTMAGLRSLTLWFNATLFHKEVKEHKRKEEDALILQALHPPPHLHSLCIRFCQSPAYPNWMTSLTLLRSMELYGCFNWESLPPLGKLPLLESLTVKFLNNVKKVGEEFLGIETSSTSSVNHIDFVFFPNLKVLEFLSLHGWEEWEYEYEKQLILRSTGDDSSSNTFPVIMPKLQRLSVMHCPKLKALPHHLLRSRALQELTIIGSHILYERYDKEKGHDWPSISHFSQIEIW